MKKLKLLNYVRYLNWGLNIIFKYISLSDESMHWIYWKKLGWQHANQQILQLKGDWSCIFGRSNFN